jgi:hypothetical protein
MFIVVNEIADLGSTIGTFGVALNEGHFKDLLFELIPPPAQRGLAKASGPATTAGGAPADLMLMGFPTRLPDAAPPALCACHAELRRAGFVCPRCQAKLCDVPTDCDVCGLMLVSAPHLARSYHHLFPVRAYQSVYVFGILLPTMRRVRVLLTMCVVGWSSGQVRSHHVMGAESPFAMLRPPRQRPCKRA